MSFVIQFQTMLKTITFEQAEKNFNKLCQKVIDNKTEIIIEGQNGKDIALVAADELDATKVTIYLLKSSANSSRLLAALERVKAQILEAKTIDEFFADLEQ